MRIKRMAVFVAYKAVIIRCLLQCILNCILAFSDFLLCYLKLCTFKSEQNNNQILTLAPKIRRNE